MHGKCTLRLWLHKGKALSLIHIYLTSVIDIIENQINESDYTAMDIAAAFLYQAMGASEISTAESKDDYDFHNTGRCV